jgi:CRP-like cAMP-binding protein
MSRPEPPGLDPLLNGLLSALPAQEQGELLPHLEPVHLAAAMVLHQPGQAISDVYFPTSCVLSVLTVPVEGGGIETGLVGREGIAGLPIFLETDRSPALCIVQIAGQALRMTVDAFRAHIGPNTTLRQLLLRYTQFFLGQVAQSAACNAVHLVEPRLCRWLLMLRGRIEGDQFPLTQEFLASMLGVRRASVSVVARGLRDRGLIEYTRGQLTILDRIGLEGSSCECFRAVEAEWSRLFG